MQINPERIEGEVAAVVKRIEEHGPADYGEPFGHYAFRLANYLLRVAAEEKLLAAVEAALQLCDEALPKFNWGASALDANAIKLLNEVPDQLRAAIAAVKETHDNSTQA